LVAEGLLRWAPPACITRLGAALPVVRVPPSIAAGFYVLYRYAPQREQQFVDIWPAALATAVIWEITRRALAFYLEKNNMISGYGPIGAAMALLFLDLRRQYDHPDRRGAGVRDRQGAAAHRSGG
jgi:uncharacterized BrkB/YihY/UPF0761 family membrane protein